MQLKLLTLNCINNILFSILFEKTTFKMQTLLTSILSHDNKNLIVSIYPLSTAL